MSNDLPTGVQPAESQPTVEPSPEPNTVSPQNLGSDTATQGAVETVTPRPEPISEQEVLTLKQQLAEQRAIQSGLTRAQQQAEKAAAEANARVEELKAKLSSYQAATNGNEGAISELQQEIDRQRQELQTYQDNLAAALQENERYKVIVGDYMGEHPIARLVQAGALPAADNIDAFRAKMDAVAATVGAAAKESVFFKMHGDRPEANPPASGELPSLGDLQTKMNAAMAAGNWDEYNKLKAQRYEVLNTEGLPTEKSQLRF